MNLDRHRDLVLFGAVIGVAFYLASAVWSALFIVALPQDRDWCKNAMEFQTGEDTSESRCVDFKNTYEELKYYRNQDMANRNRYWVYGQLIAGAFGGWLMFSRLPARRDITRRSTASVGAAMYGMTITLLVPLVLGWLLPAPVKWFPRQIVEYADARVQRELSLLRDSARDMDTDRQK